MIFNNLVTGFSNPVTKGDQITRERENSEGSIILVPKLRALGAKFVTLVTYFPLYLSPNIIDQCNLILTKLVDI